MEVGDFNSGDVVESQYELFHQKFEKLGPVK